MRDVAGEHSFPALRADEDAEMAGAMAGRRKDTHFLADAIAGLDEVGETGIDDRFH